MGVQWGLEGGWGRWGRVGGGGLEGEGWKGKSWWGWGGGDLPAPRLGLAPGLALALEPASPGRHAEEEEEENAWEERCIDEK